MENADDIFAAIESELNQVDDAREKAIKASREVIRQTKTIIKNIHGGEDVTGELAGLDGAVRELGKTVDEHRALRSSGIVEAALQEAAETHILWSVVRGEPLAGPDTWGVSSTAYLMGAADAVGELRRWLMNALLRDDLDEARRTLEAMEVLFDQLNRFNLPDAVVPLRRKQDAVRGILDRTRGLVVSAVENRRGAGD